MAALMRLPIRSPDRGDAVYDIARTDDRIGSAAAPAHFVFAYEAQALRGV